MKILHLACLNNDPEIQPNMGPKCNPVGGEPHIRSTVKSKLRSDCIIFNYNCHILIV